MASAIGDRASFGGCEDRFDISDVASAMPSNRNRRHESTSAAPDLEWSPDAIRKPNTGIIAGEKQARKQGRAFAE